MSIDELELQITERPRPGDAGPPDRPPRRDRRSGRRTRLAVAAAVAVAAVAALLALLFGGGGSPTSGEPGFAGRLAVGSTPPGAAIVVDGRPTGRSTPAEIPLAGEAGESVVVTLERDGRVAARRELVLGPGLPESWQPALPPPPVAVTVDSRPGGAEVWLDGRHLGDTTPLIVELPAGERHQLRLERDEHRPESITFTVEGVDDRTQRLFFPLEPLVEPGFLVVAAPYPVEVGIAGRTHGAARRHRIALDPGRWEVRLRAPSVSWRERRAVRVESGRSVELDTPPAVTVRVMAHPGRCRLEVDGRAVDWLPADVPLTVGEHTFEFVWDELGVSLTRSEEIGPGAERIFVTAPPAGEAER